MRYFTRHPMVRTPLLRRIPCCLLLLLAGGGQPVHGQDDFEKWKKEEDTKFQKYVEERDKAFAEFLKHEWEQMQLMQGLIPDERPKPVRLPVYAPPRVAPHKDTAGVKSVVIPRPVTSPPEPPAPPDDKPQGDQDRNQNVASASLFGFPLSIRYDDGFKTSIGTPVDKDAVSRFWEQVSQANYRDLLSQVSFQRRALHLNDWGFIELLHTIGQAIYHTDNEAILLTWFLSAKSGYETKVGYSGNQVCLLIPTGNTLFGVPYFTFAETQRRYYVVSLDRKWKLADEKIFTFKGDYPGATGLVSFSIGSPPVTDRSSASKTLRFSYAGKEHLVPVKFSRDAIRFFEFYPQTNFEVYFGAVPSTEASTSVVAALRPLVQGKNEREAVNTLLRFVQTAFQYKTDPEQFGREKPLFPDETLYYDYSDCEDRAILFAFLVRNLTGLGIVGLDYPGHIATAVRFSSDLRGDTVVYQGKKYIICDPTYVNSEVGDCMPDFKSVQPRFIKIE